MVDSGNERRLRNQTCKDAFDVNPHISSRCLCRPTDAFGERSYEEADINCGDYFIPREKRRCDGDKEIGTSAHANEYEDDHKEHN